MPHFENAPRSQKMQLYEFAATFRNGAISLEKTGLTMVDM